MGRKCPPKRKHQCHQEREKTETGDVQGAYPVELAGEHGNSEPPRSVESASRGPNPFVDEAAYAAFGRILPLARVDHTRRGLPAAVSAEKHSKPFAYLTEGAGLAPCSYAGRRTRATHAQADSPPQPCHDCAKRFPKLLRWPGACYAPTRSAPPGAVSRSLSERR